jgi:hypothetical protein
MTTSPSHLYSLMDCFLREKCQDKGEYTSLVGWNDDWEYYNQFSSQLSKESSNLIPYDNTNAYMLITKNPESLELQVKLYDLDTNILEKTMMSYMDTPRYLVLHVSMWCLDTDNIGHSCLFILCSRTRTQWFFDPSGAYNTELWQQMSSFAILPRYSTKYVSPLKDFQIQMEDIVGAERNSTCGLICCLVNLQLALTATHLNIEDVMQFWRITVENPMRWEQLRTCVFNFAGVYQHYFVDGDDKERILKNHL